MSFLNCAGLRLRHWTGWRVAELAYRRVDGGLRRRPSPNGATQQRSLSRRPSTRYLAAQEAWFGEPSRDTSPLVRRRRPRFTVRSISIEPLARWERQLLRSRTSRRNL